MDQTFGELLGAEIRERREAAGMTQRELAEESFGDPDKTDTYERRIRELESNTPPANPRAKTYQPPCDTLNITREEIRAMKAQAANCREQETTEREELREDIGPLSDALNDPSGLSRNQLIALAELFGAEKPEAQPDAALREFLTQKAEEYRSYRATIDALDDRVAIIANLKGAAQDAAAKLDFDEVEALLSRVDEVETEIAAETKVARSKNALLRNDPETAFRLLSAAADSFGSIDPLEPARQRLDYMDLLFQQGLRYPGPALEFAETLLRDALSTFPHKADTTLWAGLQNNLGNALTCLGDVAGNTIKLEEAVTAYRAALRVYDSETNSTGWAMTQSNLGNALQSLGSQKNDSDTLEQAIEAYRAALEVRSRETNSMDWAMTQNNLGNALQILARLTGNQNSLKEAISAYGNALDIYSPQTEPVRWATTQNNLGRALASLSEHAEETGALQNAIVAYEAALKVVSRETSPKDWAMTQTNLGIALQALGESKRDTKVLQEAISALRASLEVRARHSMPVAFAESMMNLAVAQRVHTALSDTQIPGTELSSSLANVDAALEIFTAYRWPYYHARANQIRDDILAAINDTL